MAVVRNGGGSCSGNGSCLHIHAAPHRIRSDRIFAAMNRSNLGDNHPKFFFPFSPFSFFPFLFFLVPLALIPSFYLSSLSHSPHHSFLFYLTLSLSLPFHSLGRGLVLLSCGSRGCRCRVALRRVQQNKKCGHDI